MFQSFFKIILLIVLFAIISTVSLKFFFMPWIWILAITFSFLIFLVLKEKSGFKKMLFIYISLTVLCLLIVEIFLYLSLSPGNIKFHGSLANKSYRISDDELGYAPIDLASGNIIKTINNDTIYNVNYQIDKNSIRSTPSSNMSGVENVLFFGGSFTFGEGVNDDETLAHCLGVTTNGKFAIYNFGFHGYGPHQMLANIQSGIYKEIIDTNKKTTAVYSFHHDHIRRASGKASWDFHGPKYQIIHDKLVRVGNFDSELITSNKLFRKIIQQLSKSLFVQTVFSDKLKITGDDKVLLSKIVAKSFDQLKSEVKLSKFIIIIWDFEKNNEFYNRLFKQSIENGAILLYTGNALKYFSDFENHYVISKFDQHPNSKAYKELANYLKGFIL